MLDIVYRKTSKLKYNSYNIISKEKQAIKTISGKFLKTDIDSVCIHGDGSKAVEISNIIKKGLLQKGIKFLPLNKLSKFN